MIASGIRHLILPKRIMIMGRPGSGKSTFALRLQNLLDVPFFHLDKYFFVENWVPRDYQEFLTIQEKLVQQSCWIIDGNSSKSFELRYSRAELCIFFNYPKWLCYWRVFKRLFYKNPAIDDRSPHCKETVRWSLLTYMWNFKKRIKFIINPLRLKYPHVQFIELCADVDLFYFEKELRRLIAVS